MVKNTTGGSKTKGQARKLIYMDSKTTNKILRIATDPLEIYAQVTKNLGNGMCSVLCTDEIVRLCHIRGKFRGRGKRDNLVGLGSWLLVGIREWEKDKDDPKKPQNCDLLEVYSDFDKEKLKSTILTINWSNFVSNDNKNNKVEDDSNNIDFTDNIDEYKNLIEETKKSGKQIDNIGIEEKEEEINFEDI
jgi:hypothetical protein